jgi:hypothetical protein
VQLRRRIVRLEPWGLKPWWSGWGGAAGGLPFWAAEVEKHVNFEQFGGYVGQCVKDAM